MENQNLGMRVRVVFNREFDTAVYRNVTEIHYNYKTIGAPKIAFESDIHGTGYTWEISDIKEFEIALETERAESM